MNVVFMGTPDFSIPAIDILASHPLVNLKYVVSMPDRKSGRGYSEKSPEVINFAKEKKIPFFQTENINKESDFLSKLESENIDFIIVLAFAQFLGERVLNLPKRGCFNIHTSLLPKYRGAAPIQYALLNGDKVTGVSIQKMVKKMDAGNIVHEKVVDITSDETGGQLYTRLKFEAALALNDFIEKLAMPGAMSEKIQDESLVSFAPTLSREDGKLDFENSTNSEIINRVRALYPWPGTFCFLGNKRLKILRAKKSDLSVSPGKIETKFGELTIGTTSGSITLERVQLEGKKPCLGSELLRGLKEEIQINPKS